MGNRPLEDEELVERARGGDVEAYAALVRAYRDVAVRTAYVVAGPDEAEDAAQEGFVKAYRALGSFRHGSRFRPWLLRIVANEAKNRRRSSGRQVRLALRAATLSTGEASPSPEASAIDAADRRALLEALDRLPDSDRLVLAYRYFLDLSEGEMAEALGVARGTVKSRLSRALARLRTLLPAEEVAP